MKSVYGIISDFMEQIDNSMLLSVMCKQIRAYEGENLPVPIKRIYFSYSGESNRVTFFTNENGKKMEKNDITVRINCFSPLSMAPTGAHILSETILIFLAISNENITEIHIGDTEYDSDVDAYKIPCRINYSSTQEF